MSSNSKDATFNVLLPRPLKRYVDQKVSSGIYESASEFVSEAINEKRQREDANAVLAGKLLDGLNSGEPIPFDDNYFPTKKRALIARAGKRKGR